MIRAVDTNVLVYAHREETPQHPVARSVLIGLAGGGEPWALPWPCVYEFLRVVTHPRVVHPVSPVAVAWRFIRALLGSPSVLVLAPSERHQAVLESVLAESGVQGNLVHDANIVALCLEHGVGELVTHDRDFTRFAGLNVRNPFS
jgi:toxin-antitoxin system PIN domain toxin